MKKVRTVNDVRNEKRNADARRFAHLDDAEAEQKRIAEVLKANPEIGVLMRNGKPVYYLTRSYGHLEHADPAALVEFIGN